MQFLRLQLSQSCFRVGHDNPYVFFYWEISVNMKEKFLHELHERVNANAMNVIVSEKR